MFTFIEAFNIVGVFGLAIFCWGIMLLIGYLIVLTILSMLHLTMVRIKDDVKRKGER